MLSTDQAVAFWEWFDQKRGVLSVREVEDRAGCPRGRIGNPYSAKKSPTDLVCTSIAQGLGLTETEVFQQVFRLSFAKLNSYHPTEARLVEKELHRLSRTKNLFDKVGSGSRVDFWLNNLAEERLKSVVEYIEWQFRLQEREEKKVTTESQQQESKSEDLT